MTEQTLAALTDQELLEQEKKTKTSNIWAAVFVGFLVGVAMYSTFRNGLNWSSMIVFLAVPIIGNTNRQRVLLKKELQKRNLA